MRFIRAAGVALAFFATTFGFTSPMGMAGDWHVSPHGNDSFAGTRDQPFATLERARDAARASGRPAAIVVAPGIHRRTQPLTLDARDSGLVIRGPRGTGPATAARLHAGRLVAASAFQPVQDAAMLTRLDPAARGKVVALDLDALGIEHTGPFPAVFSDGGKLLDLFVNDEPLPISRWPNDEPATMERVLDRGDASRGPNRRGGTFVAREDRVTRWHVADGIWLEGFWRVPWQPEVIRVATIDPATRAIAFAEPVIGGIGSKYAPKDELGDGKEPWWAVNLLEEIDRPGEWCIHFPTRTLFLWPPAQFASMPGGVYLADLAAPLIRIEGADDIVIEDLVIEGGLGDGVVIEDGRANRLTGCTFRNLGGTAVVINGGEKHAVSACEMHTLGEAGLRLSGGDRAALTPCGHTATFNWIHHVGRRRKTGAAAIHVGELFHSPYGGHVAVGCRVANNLLSDLPHAAVLYTGNDNVFERNEVCRVALASGDVGAFYTTHDWTSQGNVLRHNYVHDCPAANAFYMDDGDAGDTVAGNVVVNAACGAFIGGGHHNEIRNNLVVNCGIGIHIDARGMSRGYATSRRLRDGVASVQPDAPPWSLRYPALDRLVAGDPALPTGNVIAGNVAVGCGIPLRVYGPPAHFADNSIEEPVSLTVKEAGLATADAPFRLPAEAVLSAEVPGFEPIPFAEIGLAESPRWAKTAARTERGPSPSQGMKAFASLTDVQATDGEAARQPADRKAKLSLPRIFSDHMVLQREKPVPVWGTATPGTVVSVSFAGQSRQATTDVTGRWQVTLEPLAASREPRELRVVADDAEPVVVKDVLVGEVWLGSGQSNMAFPLGSNRGSQSLIAAADLPLLRVYTAGERPTDTAATPPRSSWKPCTPATAGDCSAVMFFLGTRLLREWENVPIGIVNASFGGTSIITWIDRDTQLAAPALREPVELDQKRHDETDLAKEMAAYHASKRYTDWLAAAAAAKAAGRKPPPQPYTPEDVYKRWVPAGGWFRLRVEPLIPYAIRGVVWYQGEADGSVAGGRRYGTQLPALITDWRRRWSDESLPFVVVQLPYWKAAPSWSGLREAQKRVLDLPQTGLIVTYDVGDPNDVHPGDKTQIGERAARWVLANVHGREIEFSGPLARAYRFHDGTAVVEFDHAAGLRGRDDGPILGFELAGADKVWHPAEANVRGKTIVATSAKVPVPIAVRYAWIPDPTKATLVNAAGLPAGPFRSDDWPLE